MKKLLSILTLLALTSCSDKFLEIFPEDTLNEGNFYKTETEFILLANGCYVPMRNYEKNQHWVLAELISDNGSKQNNIRTGEASRGVIDQFLSGSDNAAYKDFWDLSYNGITRCNKLLSELDREGVTFSKESLKDRSAGEAQFLRALYYFNLVRQFGGVPLVTTPITSQDAVSIKRATEEQVYAQIVKDLTESIARFAKSSDVAETGRANEWAAQGMLGKVQLTLKKYPEAQAALSAVISSGKYQLLANYADVFNPAQKDYKETIFAMQYSEASPEVSNQFIFQFAPHTSGGAVTLRPNINIVNAGWNQPTDDLIAAFEPGDARKTVSIGFWNGLDWDNVVRPVPYPNKYKAPIAAPDNRAGDNFPILRYSDVLLMQAEVLNEQGKSSEAVPLVQQVRTRAKLTAPITATDKVSLQNLIAKERQVELCFENHRWYDLKRTGKAIEVMTAHGKRENSLKPFLFEGAFVITPNKLLAPIPANEILVNKLQQNPGY